MKKRFVSLLLAAAMLLGLGSFAALAQSDILIENFNTATVGSEGFGSFTGGKIYAFPSEMNRSIGGTSSIFNTITPVSSGSMIISYDFYLTDFTAQKRLFQIYDSTKNGDKRSVVIYAGSDGKVETNMGGARTRISVGKWFNMTLICDIDNRVFDVYVDRKLTGSALPFFKGTDADEIGIIETYCAGAMTYIDNAYIRSGFASKDDAAEAAAALMNENIYTNQALDTCDTNTKAKNVPGFLTDGTDSNIIVDEFPSASDKSFKFVGGNGVTWLWNQLGADVNSGALLISYDFYRKSAASARLMEVYGERGNGNTRSVYIGINGDNKFTVNEGVRSDINTAPVGKWFNVSVICDLNAKKYYAYIDGRSIDSNGFGFFRTADAVRLIKTHYNTAPSVGGEMYADNMYAESFSSVEDADAVLAARKRISSSGFGISDYEAKYMSDVEGCMSDYRAIGADEQVRTAAMTVLKALNGSYIEYPKTEIWAEDFDAFEQGKALEASDGFSDVRGNVTAAAIGGRNAVSITNTGSRSRFNRAFGSLSSTSYRVSFDFMQQAISDVDMIARSTERGGNGVAAQIYSADGNIRVKYGFGKDDNGSDLQSSAVIVENYEKNRWYHIEYFVDLPSETFNVSVDGVRTSYTNYPFMFEFASKYDNIGRVFDTYTDHSGTYFLDNICVAEDKIENEIERKSLPDLALEDFRLDTAASSDDFKLEWTSSDNSVLDAATGKLSMPSEGYKNVTLTLTAVYKNSFSLSRTFDYKVKSQALIDEELQNEYDSLTIDSVITADKYYFPKPRNSELTLTWQCENPELIAWDGTVTHGSTNQQTVVYAYISYGSNTLKKKFTVTISALSPMSIGSILYENGELEEVTAVPVEGQILSVEVKRSDDSADGKLYVVFYGEDGNVISLKSYDTAGKTTIDIMEDIAANAEKIGFFIWNGAIPLGNGVIAEIPAE